MKEYIKKWNFMRFLRLVLGVIIVVQGVQHGEWLFVVLGAMFSILALLNLSTCGINNSCASKYNKFKTEDFNKESIDYEEVK